MTPKPNPLTGAKAEEGVTNVLEGKPSQEEAPQGDPTPRMDVADEAEFTEAVWWCVNQSVDGVSCPFSGNGPTVPKETPEEARQWVFDYITKRYTMRIVKAFLAQDINVEVRDISLKDAMAEEGLAVGEDHHAFSLLSVPSALRKRNEADGASLRWVAPDKIQFYKDQGLVLVQKQGDDVVKTEGSSEDGRVRTREMTLMRVPSQLRAELTARKKEAINGQVYARKEDMDNRTNAIEKKAYDAAIRAGVGRDSAMSVAKAIAGRSENRTVIERR